MFSRGQRGQFGRNSSFSSRDSFSSREGTSYRGRVSDLGSNHSPSAHSHRGGNLGVPDRRVSNNNTYGDSPRGSRTDFDYNGRGTFQGNRQGVVERGRGGASNRGQSTMPESVFHEQLVKQGLGSGSEGRPVEILSNFFKINTNGVVVYYYAINLKKVIYRSDDPKSGRLAQYELAPEKKGLEVFLTKVSADVLDKYFQQNSEVFGHIPFVHDGSQKIFSTDQFDMKKVPEVQTFSIGGKDNRFAVLISLVTTIALKELDDYYATHGIAHNLSPVIVPVYEQVFRFVIEKKFTPHQSSFYDLLQRERTSSKTFEFVRGFSISVRMTEFGLALNLHLKCSCLIERGITTVEQLVQALLNRQVLNPGSLSKEELKRVNKIISGLKVTTKHTQTPGLFTIDGLSHKTTVKHQFERFDGTPTNVQEYFLNQYNMNVKDFNLIRTKTPLGSRFSEKKEMLMLPIEVCYLLPDQFIAEHKLPIFMQSELLRLSTLLPNDYFPQVCRFVENVATIAPHIFASFGINLTTQPVKFPARVLPLPKILTFPKNFHIPANTPTKWGVFCFDNNVSKDKLDSFISLMMETAERKNMSFSKPSLVHSVNITDPEAVENCLYNLKIRKHAEFALIVLPGEGTIINKNTIYNFVKFGENQIDNKFITQCVMGEKVVNTPQGYYDNLLDKINAKLGGSNMLVDQEYILDLPFLMSETMVMGADVNHPGAIEKVPLSIAAVVGSFDDNISHYSCDVRIQKKDRTETIHDIAQMLENVLNCYKEKNGGRYPRNVIIFRDGVGDGHVKVLRDLELAPIEETLSRLIPEVRIAFIIVQKRHIVRFGLTKQNTSGRKPTYNVASGTVVDTHIVEPMIDGLILNSHFSQLGTSKPSKYTILRDDFDLKTDQIERLCFFACHNCARTRKTISIPTSIRYADLCAYRAKQLTDAFQVLNDQTTTSGSSSVYTAENEKELLAKLAKVLAISKDTSEQMYYI